MAGLPPSPSSISPLPIYTPGWRETEWSKVPCLMKQRDGRCVIPRPSDPELEMLRARPHTRPQKLAKGNKNNVCYRLPRRSNGSKKRSKITLEKWSDPTSRQNNLRIGKGQSWVAFRQMWTGNLVVTCSWKYLERDDFKVDTLDKLISLTSLSTRCTTS